MSHTHSHPVPMMVNRDEEHLRLLGNYHLLVATLNFLVLLFFVIFPLIFGAPYMKALKMPIVPGVESRLIQGLLSLGLQTLIFAVNGWSLKTHQNRISCIIMSSLECILLPYGIILGISAILVLRRESVKAMFAAAKASPTPTGSENQK